MINGSKIKNHSIAEKKLTNSAVKSLQGAPGGMILTYNAAAVSGTPAPTTIGTLLGDTVGATCTTSSGDAELKLYLKTSDGSWAVDFLNVTDDNGTPNIFASSGSLPAGSLSAYMSAGGPTANAGHNESHSQITITQTKPQSGTLIWQEDAATNGSTETCHASIEATPETVIPAVSAAGHGLRRLGAPLLARP